MNLENEVVAQAEMLIRKPVTDVFAAFVDPTITTRFWFSKSSGKLSAGKTIRWEWEMYGVEGQVFVRELEEDRRILIEWPTPVEFLFIPRTRETTLVRITNSGFTGSGDEVVAQALDAKGGFSLVLAACKFFLEHGLPPNLIGDHYPDAWVETG